MRLLPFLKRVPLQLKQSDLFDDRSFYTAFCRDLRSCKRSLLIESPFITRRRMRDLYPYLFKLAKDGVSVTINTRDPKEHDGAMREEAAIAIGILQEAGIQVLYTDNHHRKLAIIDGRVLWEGSLNIMSQYASCEIMRRIDSPELVRQMVGFLKIGKFL